MIRPALKLSTRVVLNDGADLARKVAERKATYQPEKGWLSDVPPPEPAPEHASDLLEDALAERDQFADPIHRQEKTA